MKDDQRVSSLRAFMSLWTLCLRRVRYTTNAIATTLITDTTTTEIVLTATMIAFETMKQVKEQNEYS